MHIKQWVRFLSINILLFTLISCRKDYSYEKSLIQKIQEQQAKGFLGNNLGQCVAANISGEYLTNVETDASNTVQITVTITEPGRYTITTDTVNGIFFNTSGIFYNTGVATVTLQCHGRAISIGNINFTISFNQSQCAFSLVVGDDLNTWSFWGSNKKYNGKITSALISSVLDRLGSKRQGLLVSGDNKLSSTPLNLLLDMQAELGASFLQPSTHYLDNTVDPSGGFFFSEANLIKYITNRAMPNSFPLHIISFNRATGIMEASFEGPAFNIQNSPFSSLNITKGRFKAAFAITVP